MSFTPLPDAEYLRQILMYDPDTGALQWRTHARASWVGRSAPIKAGNYLRVQIDGRTYAAHRIAWKMFTGSEPVALIDHRNGNGHDNKIANLRPATYHENNRSSSKQHNNKSGYKGVSWHKHAKMWTAQIRDGKRKICLGYFKDPEDAHQAYCGAAKAIHGDFAKV